MRFLRVFYSAPRFLLFLRPVGEVQSSLVEEKYPNLLLEECKVAKPDKVLKYGTAGETSSSPRELLRLVVGAVDSAASRLRISCGSTVYVQSRWIWRPLALGAFHVPSCIQRDG